MEIQPQRKGTLIIGMSSKRLRTQTFFATTAVFCLALSSLAQQGPSAAPSGLQGLASQAIHIITSQEVLNSLNLEPKTGKPLSTKGKWQVANQAPAACPNTTQSCIQVLYRVPEAEVSCEWVVLLEGDGGQGRILEQNADASRYFLQRLSLSEAKNLVLTRKTPTYPPIAAAAHVSGVVELFFIVDQNGKPTQVSVLSGPEMLRAAAVDALKAWTFKPLQIGNSGVPFQTIVKFTFVKSPVGPLVPPYGSVTSDL